MPDVPVSNDVILERIVGLRQDTGEIKEALACIEQQQNKFERDYLIEHAKVVQASEAAHRRLDEAERERRAMREDMRQLFNQVKELQQTVQSMVPAYRAMLWVSGIVGSALIMLVIGIVTGQIQVIYP